MKNKLKIFSKNDYSVTSDKKSWSMKFSHYDLLRTYQSKYFFKKFYALSNDRIKTSMFNSLLIGWCYLLRNIIYYNIKKVTSLSNQS